MLIFLERIRFFQFQKALLETWLQCRSDGMSSTKMRSRSWVILIRVILSLQLFIFFLSSDLKQYDSIYASFIRLRNILCIYILWPLSLSGSAPEDRGQDDKHARNPGAWSGWRRNFPWFPHRTSQDWPRPEQGILHLHAWSVNEYFRDENSRAEETFRLLYPNPVAMSIYAAEYWRHFYFLGRMLAKVG